MPHYTKAEKEAKVSLTEARRRKEVALAASRQVEAQLLMGSVIRKDEAIRVWSELLGRLRERILQIPDRVASQAAAMSGEAEIRTLLRDEFQQALTVLSRYAI